MFVNYTFCTDMGKKLEKYVRGVGKQVDYQIDELDRGIIKMLSRDGRIPFSEIANELEVTEKTIRLRYKNLVQNEIIEVVGVVNPIALGLKAGAIIQLKVGQGMHREHLR